MHSITLVCAVPISTFQNITAKIDISNLKLFANYFKLHKITYWHFIKESEDSSHNKYKLDAYVARFAGQY